MISNQPQVSARDDLDTMKELHEFPFILASQSPRRKELLLEAGYEFEIVVPDDSAENERENDEKPENFVRRLAFQKAENVSRKIDRGLIIACDTIVVCRDEILEKPLDSADAERMLKLLRGQNHVVLSGLCLWKQKNKNSTGIHRVSIARTELFMQPIDDREIENYLAGSTWQGKAGAFGYQDRNAWISIVQGSESNVVGLPTELLDQMLREIL